MFAKNETRALVLSLTIALPICGAGLALGAILPKYEPVAAAPLVFLLLANDASGAQFVRAALPMPEAQCLPLQAAIWTAPAPVAYIDDKGRDVPTIDAACVPAGQWAVELANGATVDQ